MTAVSTAARYSSSVESQRRATGGSTACRPAVASAAVASVAGLREFDSTATRGPTGTGCVASTRATSSMERTVGTSISPA